MSRRLILILVIVLTGVMVAAQPSETTYQGNVAKSGYDNNASYGPFNIGFNFTYFGNTYTQFYVSSNGLVSFEAGYDDPLNVSIPDVALPNNFIAAFWDDLAIDPSGNILYTTIGAAPNRKLIVQFRNMGFYGGPVYMGTFSVILYETSGSIQVQYRIIVLKSATRPHGESATIGIENADGSAGVEYSFDNPSAITSEQAISFNPSGATYTTNSNAIYDGVYLTTNLTLPEPGITPLITPAENADIGTSGTFAWAASSNASSYSLKISTNSSLSSATSYNAGSNLSRDISGLLLNTTYYWGVFATNATGTTWGEIKMFTTSSAPPLAAVPQTFYVEQGLDKVIKLNYTGGDTGDKSAIITVLPAQGQLYQYNAGVRGLVISSTLTTVSDLGRNVIYAANGASGNGAGDFSYRMHDATGDSPNALITVNVSPPGIPNLLYAAKSTNIELQFDRLMADPSGKQGQFAVTVNAVPATINSLSLKPGDPYAISVNLAIPLAGTETVLISYTAGDVASAQGGWLASFTDQAVSLTAQIINFPQDLLRMYNESPFTLTATASSGLGMTYSSSNLSVATAAGNVLTFLALGSSDITARQAGNGTFAPARYTKTLTVSPGDQTITFNPISTRNAGDVNFSPGATSTSGLPVSYTSSNTAVATIVSGMIHIVGGGTSLITASQTGNAFFNSALPVSQTLTVIDAASKTLNLTSVMLEGLYNGSGTMKQAYDEFGPHWPAGVADHITVELHSASAYSTIIYTVNSVPLGITGTATINIPVTYNGSYYITVRHRNSLETTTAVPVSFGGSTINQSFGLLTNVYGNNMAVSLDGRYLIFSGDVNQDGFIDTQDYVGVDNDSYNYLSGYLATDVDGNGFIDTNDYIFIDNNNYNYIGTILP
jgi:hypothetical protein